ncbi:alpha/beta fold hydrolase [Candidatus Chloroploca sp. Khr17]|uniref:alpha/beta hydrolase n=1 Tax=Candidatus Chloroploca sp. Khr17 TaxID=2496869 RepID=UPI00101CEB3D|nr:alpha/beta hydrolase [Candidatus Chloroploca sp. Khr17]
MINLPTMPGITTQQVTTSRLLQHVRLSGPESGEPVIFIHGNVSSGTFWEETMLALPEGFRGIAPDLRGYGESEFKPVDATRGLGDFADDVLALADALGYDRFHVVGHSMGGSVVFQLLATAPERLQTITLAAPGSPYGFGGTKDLDGTPCWPDFAGSGGGLVSPEFAGLLAAQNRGIDNPRASPRLVLNSFYWKVPFRPAREEVLLSSMFTIRVKEDHYPGDMVKSANWPGVGPGVIGPNNALSPKYVGDMVERILAADQKPPILWIHGADDQIVSDMSFFDLGTLGKIQAVPDWPGEEAFPPQPMKGQTRHVLQRYIEAGGYFHEIELADCGHSPYLEKPKAFNSAFHTLLHKK